MTEFKTHDDIPITICDRCKGKMNNGIMFNYDAGIRDFLELDNGIHYCKECYMKVLNNTAKRMERMTIPDANKASMDKMASDERFAERCQYYGSDEYIARTKVSNMAYWAGHGYTLEDALGRENLTLEEYENCLKAIWGAEE